MLPRGKKAVKLCKPTKKLIFAAGSLALLANTIFIVVATAFNLFIVVPVILSALYLVYVLAELTILPRVPK